MSTKRKDGKNTDLLPERDGSSTAARDSEWRKRRARAQAAEMLVRKPPG